MFFRTVEFNITNRCNYRCAGCSHFANLSVTDKNLDELSVEQVRNDLEKTRLLGIEFGNIKLIGREPLLVENILDYVLAIREVYPDTLIKIHTNGLLVPKLSNDLLIELSNKNVYFVITPVASSNMRVVVVDILQKYNIPYRFTEYKAKYFDKLILKEPLSNQEDITANYQSCRRKCTTIHNGVIYHCCVEPFIHRLNDTFGTDYPEYCGVLLDDCLVNPGVLDNYVAEPSSLCKWCGRTQKYEPHYKEIAELSDWIED